MQPAQSEPTVFDRGERMGDNWFERLADDAAPSGTGPQPIAELALEAVLGWSHPEDLDIAEHRGGSFVGDAPVEVRAGVHVRRRCASQAGKSSRPGWAPDGMKRRLSASGPCPGLGASVSRHGRRHSRLVCRTGGWLPGAVTGTFSPDTAFSGDEGAFSGDKAGG